MVPNKFEYFFSYFVKHVMKIFIGIVLNQENTLGRMTISSILILSIYENGRSPHLLVSSLISFIRGLKIALHGSFSCFLGFLTDNFI